MEPCLLKAAISRGRASTHTSLRRKIPTQGGMLDRLRQGREAAGRCSRRRCGGEGGGVDPEPFLEESRGYTAAKLQPAVNQMTGLSHDALLSTRSPDPAEQRWSGRSAGFKARASSHVSRIEELRRSPGPMVRGTSLTAIPSGPSGGLPGRSSTASPRIGGERWTGHT